MYFPIVNVLEVIHIFDDDAHFEIVEADELEENDTLLLTLFQKQSKYVQMYMRVRVMA